MASVSVSYIVHDVDEAIDFHFRLLGSREEMHPAPSLAMLSHGSLQLVSSAVGGGPGGGQAVPDSRLPQPGGWNRFGIEVEDLEATVRSLPGAGAHSRNDLVVGVSGKQILVEDLSGNPIELFEPTRTEARLEVDD